MLLFIHYVPPAHVIGLAIYSIQKVVGFGDMTSLVEKKTNQICDMVAVLQLLESVYLLNLTKGIVCG